MRESDIKNIVRHPVYFLHNEEYYHIFIWLKCEFILIFYEMHCAIIGRIPTMKM
jgi:hypothetical protein